jgi:hypothetical protein
VADDAGLWVLGTGRARILRIERGRVVRQIAVARSTLPLLTQALDGLWTATGNRLGNNYRLVRIDPRSGKRTATLHLGAEQPVALIPTDGQLCVLTGNGKLLLIRS